MAHALPPMLRVRTREYLRPDGDEPRQAVEVLHGDKVLGQLPVSRVVYEMLPQDIGKITLRLDVERAQIDTYDPER